MEVQPRHTKAATRAFHLILNEGFSLYGAVDQATREIVKTPDHPVAQPYDWFLVGREFERQYGNKPR